MANSTSPIDQIVEGTGAVAAINEHFDAGSNAMTGGRRASTSGLLVWGFYGGRVEGIDVANGTLTLAASTTSYVVMKKSDGVVSFSTGTTNWNDSTNYWRLYSVVTGSTAVTSYVDERLSAAGLFGGGGGGGGGLTNPMTDEGDLIVGGTVTAGTAAPVRLGMGAALEVLRVNAAGTGLEYGTPAGGGDVVGPASAVDERIAVFDGTTGEVIKDGGKTIAGLRAPTVQSVTSSGTVTPAFTDDIVKITAQAAALNLANPSGTAIDGVGIVIRIKDNGTARAITYGSQYRAIGVTLPTTTVISKTLYLAGIWNAEDTTLDIVAVGQQA